MKLHSSYLLVLILFVSLFFGACNNHNDKTTRPNFLFITCEDISPYLSFYGDSTAITPNLDQLASESLIFDNAFTCVGVCAPSRSSIITGMYPISIGTHNMRTGTDISGWGTRNYSNAPKDKKDREGTVFPSYSTVLPAQVKCFSQLLRQANYYCTNNSKTDYQFAAPISAWDENDYRGHFKHRQEGQPFFAAFNHEVTHESRLWMKMKDSLRVDPSIVKTPSYIPDFEQSRVDYARNYSNIEELDAQVGQLLDDLKKSGEYENTYIFFFSDHGGPLPRGKRMIYDSGLKVPFMVRFPEKNQVGRTESLFSFVDIAPTILSLAGVETPDYMQGKAFLGQNKTTERSYIFGSGDRFDNCYDRVRCIRSKDYLLVKNYYPKQSRYMDVAYRKQIPMMPEFLRMRDEGKLNETQMLWFNPTKPEIEFYDVNADSEQVNNLSHLPEYQAQIKIMLAELEHWQQRVKDKGETPEAQLLLNMWPNMEQPTCDLPQLKQTNQDVTVSCATEGADVVYKLSQLPDVITDLNHWQLYTHPIQKQEGRYLHVRSTRSGYADSQSVIVKM